MACVEFNGLWGIGDLAFVLGWVSCGREEVKFGKESGPEKMI
jgi:hypothetical protein